MLLYFCACVKWGQTPESENRPLKEQNPKMRKRDRDRQSRNMLNNKTNNNRIREEEENILVLASSVVDVICTTHISHCRVLGLSRLWVLLLTGQRLPYALW